MKFDLSGKVENVYKGIPDVCLFRFVISTANFSFQCDHILLTEFLETSKYIYPTV